MDDFAGSFVFEIVDLKVAWIVIHSTEVISVIKVKDVGTNGFPGAAWHLVWDQWFFGLFFLVAWANLTLGDVIFNFRRLDGIRHRRPLKRTPYWAVSSSRTSKEGWSSTGRSSFFSGQPFKITWVRDCRTGSAAVSCWISTSCGSEIARKSTIWNRSTSFQWRSGLWFAGKHGTKYLLDTFQGLACNESRRRTVVFSRGGAGVVVNSL